MAYSPQTWADGAGGGTPINAARLTVLENGVRDAHITADAAVVEPVAVVNDALIWNGSSWIAQAVARANLATVTNKITVAPSGGSANFYPTLGWADAVLNVAYFHLVVPADYVSGDITFRVAIRGGVGTVRWNTSTHRFRDSAAASIITTGTNDSFTLADTNTHYRSIVFPAANFTTGDTLRAAAERDGTHADDTMNGITLAFDGAWFEYTGRA